jgi:hypothetical protein
MPALHAPSKRWADRMRERELSITSGSHKHRLFDRRQHFVHVGETLLRREFPPIPQPVRLQVTPPNGYASEPGWLEDVVGSLRYDFAADI